MIEETTEWEARFAALLATEQSATDAAHDEGHVRRVVANARKLAEAEGADLAVVLPAAWLHDCVAIAKNSPERSSASRLAAERAGDFLRAAGYPAEHIGAIEHAIEAVGRIHRQTAPFLWRQSPQLIWWCSFYNGPEGFPISAWVAATT